MKKPKCVWVIEGRDLFYWGTDTREWLPFCEEMRFTKRSAMELKKEYKSALPDDEFRIVKYVREK